MSEEKKATARIEGSTCMYVAKENYDQLLQETERLAAALEGMYNDTKSEHGIDEHDILPDSSSLGQSKVALAAWSKFKETL